MDDRGDSGLGNRRRTRLVMAVPWDSGEPVVPGLRNTKSNSVSSYDTTSTRRGRLANL
jgi:hypothetical protein